MGYKILVVDDEEDIIFTLSQRLEASGYEILSASDGLEGLNKAQNEKPDLIILDVMMPKMNGYQMCRLLKFDDRYKHIPIIMLTAKTQETDKQTGEQTGADAYIGKPYEWKTLHAKILELLKQ